MNLSQIYLGWRNNLFPPAKIKELLNTTATERLNICEDCPFHSRHHKTPLRPDAHCTDCGCTLSAKTKCLSCNCPQNMWKALMTTEEEQEMLKTLKKDGKK